MTLLKFTDVSLAYGAMPLLDRVSWQIARGERVCIIGRNGTGKSSLLRLVKGDQQADDGEIWRAPGLKIGELPQELPAADQRTVFDVVAEGLAEVGALLAEYHHLSQHIRSDDDLAKLTRVQQALEARDGWRLQQLVESILSRLQLPADKILAELSGGWRRRVLLAQALVSEPDLLLLDEPTNHLDLEMRLALTLALQEFSGAVLVVSHDRHLLKSTTDEFLLVADGRVQAFDGDLEDYARWLVDYRSQQAPASPAAPARAEKTDRRVQRQASAALRQQLAPYRRQAERLERELGQVQERLAGIEVRLADSALYEAARKDELRELLADQARLKAEEASLEEAWLEALETLEELQRQLEASE